jgi:two-component system, cell cycle sensor histidine kinase and response regulator CckA
MGSPLRVVATPTATFDSELLGAAFEGNPEGLALAENERILHANSAFAELFGFLNPAEMVGRTLVSLRPEKHRCARTCSPGSAIANGHPACEFTARRKDGSTVRIEADCSSFRSQDRELVVLTVRDVSQRERRRIVRDSDRRFRAIFDAAPMGILQCGTDGRVLETNPAAERMLGCGREELRGARFGDFIHPEDIEKNSRQFRDLAEGKHEAYEAELRYRGKGEASGWIHLKVSLVRGVDDEPQFAIAMTEDITERKRSEQRLREAQKMEAVGRLVGGVAHDFNNLLTGIMLYCDLLTAGLERNSRLHHHAEEIRLAGEQGAALIQQLLAISRKQVVEPRVLCLNQTITTTRNLLSRLIGENIELRVHLDDRLGDVKMDPAQVQQILFNLVLNARDAIAEQGWITVETRNCSFLPTEAVVPRQSTPGVMLAVADTGCGMSAETRAHLFEPFFTTKAAGHGNGLGLSTVHSIVKNSGGTIEVESEPGQGTCFRVVLPRISAPTVPLPEARFSPAAGGETILLVEDNLPVRHAARRILAECGYQVLEAANGNEAVGRAESHQGTIDLLLADLAMPGMNGRELARRLLAGRPELRVLYMSGYESQEPGEPYVQDPVVLFRKPFTGAALLEKVRQILNAKSQMTPKKSGQGKREQP